MPDEIPMSGRARVTEPAERWAIEGFDPEDPSASTLVLFGEDGTALTMPFDPDLLAACTTVARAWYGEDEDDEGPGAEDFTLDDDDETDEDGPLGGISRLTGWHQVSAFWDNQPEERRNRTTIIVAIAIVLFVIVTQIVF